MGPTPKYAATVEQTVALYDAVGEIDDGWMGGEAARKMIRYNW